MSGFRGGGGHRSGLMRRGMQDVPLVKLVEEYLHQYDHLSFINMDHMGDTIRRKAPRYARMKSNTFKEQLRKAFEQYSKNAKADRDEFTGANIELNNDPLTTETLQLMEGDPSESDDDLEQESFRVIKDAGVNQMKNLYKTPSRNENMDNAQSSQRQNNGISEVTLKVADRLDCISVGSSTDASIKSLGTGTQALVPHAKIVSQDLHEDGGSESDLEIIEEVQHNKTQSSVITITATNGYGSVSPAAAVKVNDKPTTSSVQCRNNAVSVKELAAPVRPVVALKDKVPPIPEKIDKISKGVKRKHETSDKEFMGINEDMTRKRPRKEHAVISGTGRTFKDFAGSDKLLEEVCKLLMHLKHPEVYETLGVKPPRGFLLHGPPGTGKTLLVDAIAGELNIPMIKIAGTELVSGISGESENNIRELFNQAVTIAPCIVFIDEIDSVTPKRENVNKEMERRIVAQLLSCIDDLANHENGSQVLLIGATNRIEVIDTALRRAGRFDREICLGIPDESCRKKILEVICRDLKLEQGFPLLALARLTPGYVGADLQALVREAAILAVNRKLTSEFLDQSSSVNVQNTATPMEIDVDMSKKLGDETSENKVEAVFESANKEGGISDELVEKAQTISSTDSDKNVELKMSGPEKPVPVEIVSESINQSENNLGTENVSDLGIEPAKNTKMVPQTEIQSEQNKEAEKSHSDNQQGRNSETEEMSQSENFPIEKNSALEKQSESITESGDQTGEIIILENSITTLERTEVINDATVESQWTSSSNFQDPLRWIKKSSRLTENELRDLCLTMTDFCLALKCVQPSSKREGFATVPDTTWNDIGALQDVRDELQVSILGPVKYADAFEKLGLTTPAGVLLCGPPGCGKTLLAKAVANEAGINFISVKGPELLNMYVGESERAVRQCFLRARNSSPCVIFFDELDALCPRRSDVADSGSGGRIVNQLLTEMDGIESRQGVFVMAATNRPDIIDPAVLRPGRLDKILFVNLPTPDDRFEILKTITKGSKKPILAEDVDLKEIANCPECENYSGADLSALIKEASIASFRELVLHASTGAGANKELKIYRRHFDVAFSKTKPSVGEQDRLKYQMMEKRYSTTR